jgi:tRNA threonylcarbamoyladenosine biosynthesis protein TsaB
MILFIDTAFDITTLVIKKDEKFYKEKIDANISISQVLIERTKIILEKANSKKTDIRLIVFNQGPGNFTSLRVALAYVKAMAFHLNISIITLNSFQIMALSAIKIQSEHPFIVAIDARMHEIYWAEYNNYLDIFTENKGYSLLSVEKCCEKLKYLKEKKITLIKDNSKTIIGSKNYNTLLNEILITPHNIDINNIFEAIEKNIYFEEENVNKVSLLYIRDNVAQKQKKNE